MPVYEYECENCGREFEVNFPITENLPEELNCSRAGCKGMAKRKISHSSFILSGDGWAKDNYHKQGKK